MIATIQQPAYLPWFGWAERTALADVHIVLDDVPMDGSSKTNFANRNRIRTAQGTTWLTLPVHRSRTTPLDALTLADPRAPRKHARTLRRSYARAPHAHPLLDEITALLERDWAHLVPLCRALYPPLLEALKIDTPLVSARSLGVRATKSDKILGLCRAVGATTYLSGPFGRDYLDLDAFARAGVTVRFHDVEHPVWPQLHGDFEPYLSVLDLLMNQGPASRDLLATELREVTAAT